MGVDRGGGLEADKEPGLLERVARELRVRHYSPRTEEAYLSWVRRFVRYFGRRHPEELGAEDVRAFLSHLASTRKVAASTQNQALAALLFLYAEVLGIPLEEVSSFVRAKRPKRLPIVLTRKEVAALFEQLDGTPLLMAQLMYGSGLRLKECARLRVKDLCFDRGEVVIRGGKGDRDRVAPLPRLLEQPLRAQLVRVKRQHDADLKAAGGWVELPGSLERKFPAAGREWPWHWVFPATRTYFHPATNQYRRHHLHATALQKAVRVAGRAAGVSSRVNCQALRHTFATHLLESGSDIRTIQELMGHRSVATTMIYTHVLNRGGLGVRSPLDALL